MAWSVFLGIVVVLVCLHIFGIVTLHFFKGWWTLFIIIPSALALFRPEDRKGGVIGLIIGLLLLISTRGMASFSVIVKIVLAVLVVFAVVFLAMALKRISGNGMEQSYNVFFSGQEINSSGTVFDGCNCVVAFGGLDLDLTNAVLNQDCTINAFVIFGGIDIRVPENANLKINSTSILGGVDNKTNNSSNNQFTININATATFGGVDIK